MVLSNLMFALCIWRCDCRLFDRHGDRVVAPAKRGQLRATVSH